MSQEERGVFKARLSAPAPWGLRTQQKEKGKETNAHGGVLRRPFGEETAWPPAKEGAR